MLAAWPKGKSRIILLSPDEDPDLAGAEEG